MKKWQVIESRNRFYCDGRCLTGHDIGIFILGLFLITMTSALFFAFDCPYLTKRLSPVIPVLAAILFVIVLCFLFRTACSDPGILPRATPDEVLYLERSHLTNTSSNVSLQGRAIEIQMAGGHTMQLKFCSTCHIFRPPRVSHCSLCNACIANFDHHCPWVGNCVGLRNYRYFYLFLLSLSLLCIYILAFNITNIVLRGQDKPSFVDAIRDTPATVVQALICFFSVWSLLGLWGYHTYLICRSVTTNEDIKNTWNSSHRQDTIRNPFSKGNPCLNCFATLCGPLPPSGLDLRTIIESPTSTGMITTHTTRYQFDQRTQTAIKPSYSGYQQDRYSTHNYV